MSLLKGTIFSIASVLALAACDSSPGDISGNATQGGKTATTVGGGATNDMADMTDASVPGSGGDGNQNGSGNGGDSNGGSTSGGSAGSNMMTPNDPVDSGSSTSANPGIPGGPRFPGSGTVAGFPLAPGFGPDTADDCPPLDGMSTAMVEQVRDNATLCFYGDDPMTPAATIEQVIESVEGQEYVHLRVTFNPDFVDNTFGMNSVGWTNRKNGMHAFKDLVGSDHVELLVTDCTEATVMQFRLDYISEDNTAPSGYSSLGVSGGDGRVIVGDESTVLAAATSFDRNLNGCGFGEYTVDSPATDENYTPNPDAPEWDYRVVYEVWLDSAAFQDCFGQAYIEEVHASPSKGDSNTQVVEPGPCPPDWDIPYCPPSVIDEGGNCGDGSDEPCPQNTTEFESEECPMLACVPTPFAGYENRAACPNGFVLDIESEGQYCLPEDGSCP